MGDPNRSPIFFVGRDGIPPIKCKRDTIPPYRYFHGEIGSE